MSYTDLYLGNGPLIAGPDPSAHQNDRPAAYLFGIPFDSTHSYRPGCRFGPDSIRETFNNIEVFHPDLGVDLEQAYIRDLGNMAHTASARVMIDAARRTVGELAGSGLPVFILGGEHLLTYGTYPAFPDGTGYVVFDAHYDLRDGYGDMGLSHASYLRRVAEETDPGRILHVGARAFVAEELEFLRENHVATVTDAEIRNGCGPELIRDHVSSFDCIYASFDLDVLDPAFAPGVGNPEAEGITSRELFSMIRALSDVRVAGADIVELNPYHDNGSTAAVAAKILSVMAALSIRYGK